MDEPPVIRLTIGEHDVCDVEKQLVVAAKSQRRHLQAAGLEPVIDDRRRREVIGPRDRLRRVLPEHRVPAAQVREPAVERPALCAPDAVDQGRRRDVWDQRDHPGARL